jgi:hypothetical protein
MKMKKTDMNKEKSPSKRITKLGDWRSKTLANVRKLIKEADPKIKEERKWKKPSNPAGVPVWSLNGIVCTGETYKDHIKLTFAKGASIKDPKGIFTSMGAQRRSIDLYEGEKVNASAFKEMVRAAVKLNSKSR